MGERFIWDKKARELVPSDEFYRRQRAADLDGRNRKRVNVMSDIEPYQSIISDEVIGSRSAHRDHLRRHNCIELGNEAPKWMRERAEAEKHNAR